MGVFDNVNDASHLGDPEGSRYICMACETTLEVQYHSCPVCDGYDIRRTKWLCE